MSETLQISTSAVVLTIEIVCGLISTTKIAFELVGLIDITKSRFTTNDNNKKGNEAIAVKRNFLTNTFTIILLSSFIFFSIIAFLNSEHIFKILSIIVFITVILITIILTFLYNKLHRLHTTINTFITDNQHKIDMGHTVGNLYMFNNY
jgi:hypothetical protein